MKTNFPAEMQLVLMGENSKVIAIIKVKEKENIIAKVIRAIQEDLIADEVRIEQGLELPPYAPEFSFTAFAMVEGNANNYDFTLVIAPQY